MTDAVDPLEDLIARALAEDLGDGDATSLATVPEDLRAVARITQKAPGVLSGIDVAEAVFRALDPSLQVVVEGPEGEWREGGPVLRVEGSARSILGAERTALNLLGRLSGVATLTRRHADALAGTGAVVLDTRKTTPGLRWLEKRAVVAGGGANHRIGLYDEILVKENHAAAAGGVGAAIAAAHAARPDLPIVSEVQDLAELREALDAATAAGRIPAEAPDGPRQPAVAGSPFRVLLDNMSPETMREAVAITDGRAPLEASGNVDLATIGAAGATGVDFVSVGALTHSAPTLDLSLILEPTT